MNGLPRTDRKCKSSKKVRACQKSFHRRMFKLKREASSQAWIRLLYPRSLVWLTKRLG